MILLVLLMMLGAPSASEPLSLGQLLAQLEGRSPSLEAAAQGPAAAQARLLSASGAFDLDFNTEAKAVPIGEYDYGWVESSFSQPTRAGGLELEAGYRVSDGELPSYLGEYKTVAGGEVWAGIAMPLLQGLLIDKDRANLALAQIGVDAEEAKFQTKRVKLRFEASLAYWKWQATGRRLDLAEELLQIAEARDEAVRTRVSVGQLPELDAVDNQRIIVERRAKLADAQRDLIAAEVQLSLYLRDQDGDPLRPDRALLPPGLTPPTEPGELQTDALVQQAMTARPELTGALATIGQADTYVRLAKNARIPKLDVEAAVIQSVNAGSAALPGEVAVGLKLSVPLQRREARGELAEAEAKRAKAEAELRWLEDLITAEVTTAVAAVDNGWQRLVAAEQAVELARTLEEAEQQRYELGATDLLTVYIREQAFADAVRAEVSAWYALQSAITKLEATLGVVVATSAPA